MKLGVREIARFATAALTLTVLVPVGPAAAEPVVGSAGAGISCSQAAVRTGVTVSSDLDPSCTYTGGFDIAASNVVFDCKGARIHDESGTRAIGILVRTPADDDLDNVTIRNCHVDGFVNSIHIRRDGFNQLHAGPLVAGLGSVKRRTCRAAR